MSSKSLAVLTLALAAFGASAQNVAIVNGKPVPKSRRAHRQGGETTKARGAARSAFVGRAGLDGQRMDAFGDQRAQGIIHKAMALQS